MVKRTLCAAHVIFMCLMAFIALASGDDAIVKKDIAKVMQSPYGDASPVGMAKKGDRFKIRYPQGDWYCIEYNGSAGWIYSANITIEQQTPPAPPAVTPVMNTNQAATHPAAATPAVNNNQVATRPAATPVVNTNQSGARPAQDADSLQKVKPPQPIIRTPSFSISDARAKKNVPIKHSTVAGAQSKQAEPIEKIVSEIAASVDSSKKSGQIKAVAHADTFSPVKVPSSAPVPKYFEVLESPTKILKDLSPQSPILVFAQKNEVYPLVYAGSSWCKIIVKNDTGWAESSRGRVIDSPSVITAKIPAIVIISLLAAGLTLVLIFVIIFVVISMRRQKFKKSSLKRDVLIISHVEKEMQYSLTDSTTTLSKCFSEIGFKVSAANGVDHARTLLTHYAPDVIVIDWRLENNIQTTIRAVVSDKETTSSILVIFYNVPDPTEISKRNTAPNMFFLGLIFSDRDIFKIVTPLIITGKSHHTVKKSVQTSALEGDIRLGNLLEVMQFIEIGKKTGCLYITMSSPFGLIYFEHGRVTYAASKTALGKDAIFEILNLKEGHFHLVLDKVSQTKNVNLSTLEVLMDWTKVKDEALRG